MTEEEHERLVAHFAGLLREIADQLVTNREVILHDDALRALRTATVLVCLRDGRDAETVHTAGELRKLAPLPPGPRGKIGPGTTRKMLRAAAVRVEILRPAVRDQAESDETALEIFDTALARVETDTRLDALERQSRDQ